MGRTLLPAGPIPAIAIAIAINKKCAKCNCMRSDEEFFRNGGMWKTCNICSAKQYAYRKSKATVKTRTTNSSVKPGPIPIEQATDPANSQSAQYAQDLEMVQQQIEQIHFEQFSKQDPRMTVQYLLTEPHMYDPPPLELYARRQRLLQQTQQLGNPEALQTQSDRQSVFQQDTQTELFVQPIPSYFMDPNQDLNQGMLPNYELLDPNFHCNLGANGEEQFDFDLDLNIPGPGDQEFDFEACIANALDFDLQHLEARNDVESFGFEDIDVLDFDTVMQRVDSVLMGGPCSSESIFHSYSEPATDVDMVSDPFDGHDLFSVPFSQEVQVQEVNSVDLDAQCAEPFQAQRKAPTKRTRKPRKKSQLTCNKPPPISLQDYFATFDASADILRQPASPPPVETWSDKIEHHISELGHAIRLSALHKRWRNTRNRTKLLKEANVLVKLERDGLINPWGPLDDLMTLYDNGAEDILTTNGGHGAKLDWHAAKQVELGKQRLTNSLKYDLLEKANELTKQNVAALFELFVDAFGHEHTHYRIKLALNEQVRRMEGIVADDCKKRGVMRLKTDQWGAYTGC